MISFIVYVVIILTFVNLRYRAIILYISIGDPLGRTHRRGSSGLLAENTCMAIARVAVENDLHGQYNPIDGSLMLAPTESKVYVIYVTKVSITYMPFTLGGFCVRIVVDQD